MIADIGHQEAITRNPVRPAGDCTWSRTCRVPGICLKCGPNPEQKRISDLRSTKVPNRHSRRVPAGGPSPCGPGGPAAAGPLLAVHRELGAKAEKGARPVTRRRRKGRLQRQGLALDAADVRRSFRLVASAAGLDPRNGLSASYGTVSCGCYQALGDHRGKLHTWSAMEACRHGARVPE